jgi:hypothetical protein
MRAFRSRIRSWALLGLLALAVQIALSFGHVHLDEIAATSPTSIAAANSSQSGTPNPAHKSGGAADDFCAICALIHLASSAVPALPPVLALPVGFTPVEPPAPRVLVLASSPDALLFQARAPPSV